MSQGSLSAVSAMKMEGSIPDKDWKKNAESKGREIVKPLFCFNRFLYYALPGSQCLNILI